MAEVNNLHNEFKTWKERNQFLFKNEIMSDCSFIVIDGSNNDRTIIPAHKYILGGNSADFYNLFYLMKSSDEIPIEGTSIESFTQFLEFLYTETTNLTMENVEDLLKLAKRFSVNHFEEFCFKFLSENVNDVEAALTVLEKYSDYLMPDLTTKCMKIISHSRFIFESPSFLKISIKTLTAILKSKQLKGFQEITIYNGVNKWAENYCRENQKPINSHNKRLAVQPAIKYIRFASMTSNEVISCTLNDPILTNAEAVQIMQFIVTGETNCSFSAEKRPKGFKKLNFLLAEPEFREFSLFLSHRVFSIYVDKPIHLIGFGILGRTLNTLNIQNPEKFTLQLKDNVNNIVLENEVEIHFDGTEKIYDMLYDQFFMLKPKVLYRAYMIRQLAAKFRHHCFENCRETKQEVDGVQITIRTPV